MGYIIGHILGQLESPLFELLGKNAEPTTIPEQDLDQVASPVHEDKQVASEGILPDN